MVQVFLVKLSMRCSYDRLLELDMNVVGMENGKMIQRLDVEYYGENQNNWHRIFTIGPMRMVTLIACAQFTSCIAVS